MSKECHQLHALFNSLPLHDFQFEQNKIPANGIYILFEDGESAHETKRIVRIGTHTGDGQLPSRLRQHFKNENKDRSIFRKNIGRALLNKANDPFLAKWELDLTPSAAKKRWDSNDTPMLQETELAVTDYMLNKFRFVVFAVGDKNLRLEFESKIISTLSLCDECMPSKEWLGHSSPKNKIRESGLWLVNELYKTPLSKCELAQLEKTIALG